MKTVRARKTHICSECQRNIVQGEDYFYSTGKDPVYTDDVMGNEVQTGIHYYHYKLCIDCDRKLKIWEGNDEENPGND